jgi:hypothetical protein
MLELESQHYWKHELSRIVAAKTLNLKQMEARDRRRAAIHEAGHHVMACYRGKLEVYSWIERAGDPTRYESSWIGHCRWRIPHPGSLEQDVMIGVAGMIAEQLWLAGNDPDRMDNIYDLMDDPNCMSESDWCGAGIDRDAGLTEVQCPQIEAAIDLLSGPLWSELLRQARRLIVESRDIDT